MKKLWIFSVGLLMFGCQNHSNDVPNDQKLIIQTLERETQYFCERNLSKWQQQWYQKPFASKMYTGKKEFEEFIGWEAINQFTVEHIQRFPEPIPIPELNNDYTIELFDDTAFVFYAKSSESGAVREIRFMVKEDEKWKIARMQTIF